MLLQILFLLTPFVCLGVSLKEMTLEEKVGQLLFVHFRGEEVNAEAKLLIEEVKVGGIIYFKWANGLKSEDHVKELSKNLQKLAKIPLFIGIDQEGGVVTKLDEGFTVFPGNRALGEANQVELAEESAFFTGKELISAGINLNFAPVVDINVNPRNPVIGVRSFSEDPEKVLLFGAKALKGYQKANVIPVLKHFPGHGDVESDSHYALPLLLKGMKELEEGELLPFRELSKKGEMIMTGHLLVPAFDSEFPATLSEKTLNYLKNTLGFKGVIISDSLVMEGVLKQCERIEEVAIKALKAGCDLLLLGGGGGGTLELSAADVQRVHQAIIQAVKEENLEWRVDQAVAKIVALKEKRVKKFVPAELNINKEEHQELAKEIATLALKQVRKGSFSMEEIRDKKSVFFAPKVLKEAFSKTDFSGKISFFEEGNLESHKEGDVVVVFSYNAWKNPSQKLFIESLLALEKTVILVVSRDPLDVTLFKEPDLLIITFSPTSVSLQAVLDILKKG